MCYQVLSFFRVLRPGSKFLRNNRKILFLILSDFKRINELFPQKSWENHMVFDDFKGEGIEVIIRLNLLSITLREKCPYSEFFWSVFSRILTEYGDTYASVSPYSVWMQENTDEKESSTGTSRRVRSAILQRSLDANF